MRRTRSRSRSRSVSRSPRRHRGEERARQDLDDRDRRTRVSDYDHERDGYRERGEGRDSRRDRSRDRSNRDHHSSRRERRPEKDVADVRSHRRGGSDDDEHDGYSRDKIRRRDSRADDDRERSHRGDRSHRRHSEGQASSSNADRKHSRSRREDSEDGFVDIRKLGVKEIGEDDYFLKSAEFKYWLRDIKGKYLDEMTGDAARRYFRKFVRRWNDGALSAEYYKPPPVSSSSNTAYKWSFNGPNGRRSPARTSHRSPSLDRPVRSPSPTGEIEPPEDPMSSEEDIGPSLPPSLLPHVAGPGRPNPSDRQLAKEEAQEAQRAARKAERRTAYERADELVPKGVGKEGKMAEKRASNAANKEMRDKEVGGLEMDEGTLMGEESSFQAALRARETAQGRRAEKRADEIASRKAAIEDRMAERRQKEAATMDMLKAMAKQRFG